MTKFNKQSLNLYNWTKIKVFNVLPKIFSSKYCLTSSYKCHCIQYQAKTLALDFIGTTSVQTYMLRTFTNTYEWCSFQY